MALLHVNYWSPSLQKETACIVLLPERQPHPGPYPVFYLLHGLSDDCTAWLRWTSLERYARDLPLMIVLADGHRSFYCDAPQGYAYESAIVRDLVSFIERHFRTIRSRRGRVIGGLSMGAYGALKMALKYPDKFAAVTAHSGVYLHIRERWWERPEEKGRMGELGRIYADEKTRQTNDVFALAERLRPEKAPAIWLDCGTEDPLRRDNQALQAHLRRLKIKHEYHEFPGAHDWSYWDRRIQDALAFHRRVLGL